MISKELKKAAQGVDRCKSKTVNADLPLAIVSFIAQFGGIGIIWWKLGWLMAIAGFLILCGHNMEKHFKKP